MEGLTEEERVIAEDVLWIMSEEHKEIARAANHIGDEMTSFVFDFLGLRKSDESFRLRQDSLKRTSLAQLCAWMLDSNKSKWSAQPHYYGAILVEMFDRVMILDPYLKELKTGTIIEPE